MDQMDEKKAWRESIRSTVKIKNEAERIAANKKNANHAKQRYQYLIDKHQKKQTIGAILWYCRKLEVDSGAVAIDLGLKKYLYANDVDDLMEMEKEMKKRYKEHNKKHNK